MYRSALAHRDLRLLPTAMLMRSRPVDDAAVQGRELGRRHPAEELVA